LSKVAVKVSTVHWSGGGLWVRLGKIKCAAKALACVSACSSFNFTKRWHFVHCFSVRLLSVVSSATLAANVSRLHEVAMNQDQAFTNIKKTFN
jgi:hypothetical protein